MIFRCDSQLPEYKEIESFSCTYPQDEEEVRRRHSVYCAGVPGGDCRRCDTVLYETAVSFFGSHGVAVRCRRNTCCNF